MITESLKKFTNYWACAVTIITIFILRYIWCNQFRNII